MTSTTRTMSSKATTGIVPERTGKSGRPEKANKVPAPDLNYAIVHKTRAKGRVTEIEGGVIFGTVAPVLAALALSPSAQDLRLPQR